jgi:hypothetical protein
MQAVPRALAGTRASSSLVKSTFVHQHGPCATPLARSISMAQRLGWPQIGQRAGSKAVGSVTIREE